MTLQLKWLIIKTLVTRIGTSNNNKSRFYEVYINHIKIISLFGFQCDGGSLQRR